MKLIKIIVAVDRIPVTSITWLTRVSENTVSLSPSLQWESIPIKPHAQLVINSKVEDKNKIWTAKLSLKTCEEIVDNGIWAYRCKTQDGQFRLLGTLERPYPTAIVAENMPENVADSQLNEVTVSWQSPHFIPYIAY